MITNDGGCRKDITANIVMAKMTLCKKKVLITGRLKKKIAKELCLLPSSLATSRTLAPVNMKENDMDSCEIFKNI